MEKFKKEPIIAEEQEKQTEAIDQVFRRMQDESRVQVCKSIISWLENIIKQSEDSMDKQDEQLNIKENA